MAGAFVDGALKGFEAMERHKTREFNQQRLTDLDQREDERYKAGQARLAALDNERREARAEDVSFRNKQAEATKEHRDKVLQSNSKQRTWQQNWAEQQAQWKKDQNDIALGWQAFRQDGQVPEEFESVFERNPTKDPRKFADPAVRQSVKELHGIMGEAIKSGQLSRVNDPKAIQLFDTVFKEKINASVGEYDKDVGAKIKSVQFAGFVPVEAKDGSVALALQVTYENDFKEIKPMTKGRTSQSGDPVLTFTPKELIGTINAAATMADMLERPEYYDRLGQHMNASAGFSTSTQNNLNSTQDDYRKQLNSIQDEMTKALAKIEGGSDLDYLDEGGREKAKQRVRELYQQRIDQLNKSYGAKSSAGQQPEQSEAKSIEDLSDEELLEQLTSSLGAQ